MATQLNIKPIERGTAAVTISPRDETGVSLAFGDLISPQWQLMRQDRSVVNNRTFALSPMTSLTIVLTGDDLALDGPKDTGKRVISFQMQYNSSLGSGLHLKAECEFVIQDMIGQANQ